MGTFPVEDGQDDGDLQHTEDDNIGEDQDLSMLIVKQWGSDCEWARGLGSQMFQAFSIDGDLSRVAAFWAIIKEDAVELYRITAAFDSIAPDLAAEVSEFLLIRFEIEATRGQTRSSELTEAFKQIYEVVAACGAPVHGLVCTCDGSVDGTLFASQLTHADTRELLAEANRSLGRRLDFIDISGDCSVDALAILANLGPYCSYVVVSNGSLDCTYDASTASPELRKRYYLSNAESMYQVSELPGRSVLAALCARVRFMEDWWRDASDCSLASNVPPPTASVYRTEHVQDFLRVGGKLVAAGDTPAALQAAQIQLSDRTYYDLRKFLSAQLEGEILLQVFASLHLVHAFLAPGAIDSAQHGCYVEPCTIRRWAAAFDGLSEDERALEEYQDFDPSASQQIEHGGTEGLIYEEVHAWNREPRFPEISGHLPDVQLTFPLDTNVQGDCFHATLELSDGVLRAGTALEIKGEIFVVQEVRAVEQWTYVKVDREHGAAEGDLATLAFSRPVSFAEVTDELAAVIQR